MTYCVGIRLNAPASHSCPTRAPTPAGERISTCRKTMIYEPMRKITTAGERIV